MGRRKTWPSGLAMSGVSRTMAWMLRPCNTTIERGTAGLPSNGWPMRQKSAGWRARCMQATGPRCDWTCATYPWMAIIWTLPQCSSSIVACFTVTTVMSLRTPSSAPLPGRGRSAIKRTKTTWGPPVATHWWPSGSTSGSPSSWPQLSAAVVSGWVGTVGGRVSNVQFPSGSLWGQYAGASAGNTRGPHLRPGPGGYPYTQGVEGQVPLWGNSYDLSSYDHIRWRTSATVSSGRAWLWHLHAMDTHIICTQYRYVIFRRLWPG